MRTKITLAQRENQLQSRTPYTVAMKEWAYVIEALGRGEQSLVIRKGGILDQEGLFKPEHASFAFFPTYEHQNQDDLNPEGRKRLELCREPSYPSSEQERVLIQFAAQVEFAFWLEKEACLNRLAGMQCLTRQALEKRYHYGSRKGLTVLCVRVFRIIPAIPILKWPGYAGCKSWILLKTPIQPQLTEPVINQAKFAEETRALKQLLRNG